MKFSLRHIILLIFVGLCVLGLSIRLIDLQIWNKDFLIHQGDARVLRDVNLRANRGMIVDRLGAPLAVSAPVESVWLNPRIFLAETTISSKSPSKSKSPLKSKSPSKSKSALKSPLKSLSDTLAISYKNLSTNLLKHKDREFMFVARQVTPQVANAVKDLNIPGVYLQREYRRYYPLGEAALQVIGVTNIDGRGQEGLELTYNSILTGQPGLKRVLKDRKGHIVDDLEMIRPSIPGQTLTLSLDRRLQYLAYRELKSAVKKHRALGGSLVLLDVDTGEILAMVNQPAFNPNNRANMLSSHLRNRAVTDIFEPGSVMKTFSILAALESGKYTAKSMVNTHPGYMYVRGNRHPIKDLHNYGLIDLTTVFKKSSNVGISTVILTLPRDTLGNMYTRMGFGQSTGIDFPGEQSGVLNIPRAHDDFGYSTLAFGYSLSATTLQLASAYATIASGGIRYPVSLLKQNEAPTGERVLSQEAADEIKMMLAAVDADVATTDANKEGIVKMGYPMAGKSGTVRKLGPNGYDAKRHLSLYAGFAPVSRPKFVMALMIDEPRAGEYYGRAVAAPVFKQVMLGSLRLYNISPEKIDPPL